MEFNSLIPIRENYARKESAMSKKTYYCPHYKVPKPYTYPVAHVLNLFRNPHNMSLKDAIDSTYKLYTDRNFKYHIPKSDFSKKKLKYHVIRWFEVEATPIPDEVYQTNCHIIY